VCDLRAAGVAQRSRAPPSCVAWFCRVSPLRQRACKGAHHGCCLCAQHAPSGSRTAGQLGRFWGLASKRAAPARHQAQWLGLCNTAAPPCVLCRPAQPPVSQTEPPTVHTASTRTSSRPSMRSWRRTWMCRSRWCCRCWPWAAPCAT